MAALVFLLGCDPEPAPDESTAPTRISTQRVTSSGNVISAAISPDGRYVAYVESVQGQQSLNLQSLQSGESFELVPPRLATYWGVRFTNDSDSVVYAEKSSRDPKGALYRMPALGGQPEQLISHVDSPPCFSPDGTRMAWVRAEYPSADQSALMIASADGTRATVLATRSAPESFAPIFHTGPSWSPDGTLVAASVIRRNGDGAADVSAFDLETGEAAWTSDYGWKWAAMVGWLPEGDSLLAIGEAEGRSGAQVWLLPYPKGEPRQLTDDLLDYRVISLSADGQSLLTIPSERQSSIWLASWSGLEPPARIADATLDGMFGFALTPDERIVSQTLEGGKLDLSIMNVDGTGRRLLTDDQAEDRFPSVTPRGEVIYHARTPSGAEIRKMDLDGGNRQVLASAAPSAVPFLSPDGERIVYERITAGLRSLWSVAVEGGTAQPLTLYESFLGTVSPDGERLAFYYLDPDAGRYRIGVTPLQGGDPELSFDVEPPGHGSFLRWAQDGQALLINTMPTDRANLWRLPLDGSEPQRLTRFDDSLLYWVDFSPDGETMAIARGNLTRDVVVIRDFR